LSSQDLSCSVSWRQSLVYARKPGFEFALRGTLPDDPAYASFGTFGCDWLPIPPPGRVSRRRPIRYRCAWNCAVCSTNAPAILWRDERHLHFDHCSRVPMRSFASPDSRGRSLPRGQYCRAAAHPMRGTSSGFSAVTRDRSSRQFAMIDLRRASLRHAAFDSNLCAGAVSKRSRASTRHV